MDQIPHGLIVNTNDSHSTRRHLKQPIDEKRLDQETERNSKKSITTCKTNLRSRSTQTGTHSKNPSRWKQIASFPGVYEEILSYTCRYLTRQHKILKKQTRKFQDFGAGSVSSAMVEFRKVKNQSWFSIKSEYDPELFLNSPWTDSEQSALIRPLVSQWLPTKELIRR